MSKYPRDEFDKVPETSSRQGVHRERLIPSRSGGLGLIITVGVLALILGLAAFLVLPRLGIGQSGAAPAPAADSSTSAQSPDPQVTETEPAEPETAEPAPSEDPEPSESPEPEPEPAPEAVVDRSQPVVVLNASGVGGLGANVSARIAGDGWTTAQVANWGGTPLQSSVIFYNGPEQLANAQELSRILGIPALSESPDFNLVTVVTGPGFQ
ncbi:LytR C-terminal domain-containing protein [Arthrobacter citreus]|uniref:LytR C-terminal domain-containing protein n=1 Tax=Arthrobacter TaxID=1663 RepID=UPI0012650277|nr:LytR C-terminal domain-containing protein [Arthrobacter gandavensis]